MTKRDGLGATLVMCNLERPNYTLKAAISKNCLCKGLLINR